MSRLRPEFLLRTKAYASAIIRLFVLLPKEREEVRVLGRQMLRAGTSVTAQVREANRGRSTAEFVAKLGGALQEADETMLWLELLRDDCAIASPLVSDLESESSELIGIMTTIINRSRDAGSGEHPAH